LPCLPQHNTLSWLLNLKVYSTPSIWINPSFEFLFIWVKKRYVHRILLYIWYYHIIHIYPTQFVYFLHAPKTKCLPTFNIKAATSLTKYFNQNLLELKNNNMKSNNLYKITIKITSRLSDFLGFTLVFDIVIFLFSLLSASKFDNTSLSISLSF